MRPTFSDSQHGLTLIELLVALTIFALLGALSWRALAEASISETRLDEGFQRWRTLTRAVQHIETDLLQVAPNPVRGSPALVTTVDGQLHVLRIDPDLGVYRVGFRLVDGKLQSLRWNGREPAGNPDCETMLDGVRALNWSFLQGGKRTSDWSPRGSATLPDAVILELDLIDVGTITRVVALR